MIYPVGTILACKHCGEHLLTLKREVKWGDVCNVDDVEAIPPHPQPKSGDAAVCTFCKRPHGFTKLILPERG